jgi:pentatricopeptide repeat protein
VIPGYLKPPTSTCVHVLNLSARNGNIRLATDVFRILSERSIALTSHHYEMLLEAYLNAGDLNAAISVILIMAEGGIKVDEASIHPLYTYLKVEEGRPMQAFDILQNAEATSRKVPTAAINACVQASVNLGKLEEAIEIYKALHTVSRAGPNTATFNILFQGCHRAGRKGLAFFLAAEMLKLNIKPNALTYDRLVLVCCQVNDLDDAFNYYEEMRSMNLIPRRGMFEMLIDKGLEEGDSRVCGVMDDMKSCGYPPGRERKKAVLERFGPGSYADALEDMSSESEIPSADITAPSMQKDGLDEGTTVEGGLEPAKASSTEAELGHGESKDIPR